MIRHECPDIGEPKRPCKLPWDGLVTGDGTHNGAEPGDGFQDAQVAMIVNIIYPTTTGYSPYPWRILLLYRL